MERVTAVRRLLEAANFLRSRPGSSGQIPLFSTVFTARAYSHEPNPPGGQLLWQAGGQNPDYVGHGLRSVAWHEDSSHVDYLENRGFQPNFLGMGGSYATMLTMFPKTGAANGPVESYFWCTPGVEAMGTDPVRDPIRFHQHMDAHASNTLLPSHFHTFLNFPFEVRVYVP